MIRMVHGPMDRVDPWPSILSIFQKTPGIFPWKTLKPHEPPYRRYGPCCEYYPEITIAIGIDIKAQMKIKSCITGFKNENGNVWVKEATIENFATAKLIFDLALIRDPRTVGRRLVKGQTGTELMIHGSLALISSYVLVNKAIIMLSKRMLTNIRNRISKNVDTPFFQGFQ